MSQSYYTICMDDNSKLSGFSEQSFLGMSIAKEGDLLMIFLPDGEYINFNWSRVRWYRCERLSVGATADESEAAI